MANITDWGWGNNFTASANANFYDVTTDFYSGISVVGILLLGIVVSLVLLTMQYKKIFKLYTKIGKVLYYTGLGIIVSIAGLGIYAFGIMIGQKASEAQITIEQVLYGIGALIGLTILGYIADKVGTKVANNFREAMKELRDEST